MDRDFPKLIIVATSPTSPHLPPHRHPSFPKGRLCTCLIIYFWSRNPEYLHIHELRTTSAESRITRIREASILTIIIKRTRRVGGSDSQQLLPPFFHGQKAPNDSLHEATEHCTLIILIVDQGYDARPRRYVQDCSPGRALSIQHYHVCP